MSAASGLLLDGPDQIEAGIGTSQFENLLHYVGIEFQILKHSETESCRVKSQPLGNLKFPNQFSIPCTDQLDQSTVD